MKLVKDKSTYRAERRRRAKEYAKAQGMSLKEVWPLFRTGPAPKKEASK